MVVPSAARVRILLAFGARVEGAQLLPPSLVSNPPTFVPTQPLSGETKPIPNSSAPLLVISGISAQCSPPSTVFATRCCRFAGSSFWIVAYPTRLFANEPFQIISYGRAER